MSTEDSLVPFPLQEKEKKYRQNERINCIIKRKPTRRASFSVVFPFFFSLSFSIFFSPAFARSERTSVCSSCLEKAYNIHTYTQLSWRSGSAYFIFFFVCNECEHMYSIWLLSRFFLDDDSTKRKYR